MLGPRGTMMPPTQGIVIMMLGQFMNCPYVDCPYVNVNCPYVNVDCPYVNVDCPHVDCPYRSD